MDESYVMRRANGDLLAVEIQGKPRIPIWPSRDAVTRYKALNPELMFFWPVKLDRSVVSRVIAGQGGEGATQFFLLSAEAPDAQMDAGRQITVEELLPEPSTVPAGAPANS